MPNTTVFLLDIIDSNSLHGPVRELHQDNGTSNQINQSILLRHLTSQCRSLFRGIFAATSPAWRWASEKGRMERKNWRVDLGKFENGDPYEKSQNAWESTTTCRSEHVSRFKGTSWKKVAAQSSISHPLKTIAT
jgi:hypothetical protein